MSQSTQNVAYAGQAVDATHPLPVTNTAAGGLADPKVTDADAASASTNALLRGILETLQTIATNTTPTP